MEDPSGALVGDTWGKQGNDGSGSTMIRGMQGGVSPSAVEVGAKG